MRRRNTEVYRRNKTSYIIARNKKRPLEVTGQKTEVVRRHPKVTTKVESK